jgi:Protein of unknown function (DUF3575)
MPAFYALALGAALLSSPDTTVSTASVHQIVKLGIHGFNPGVFALSYERQLSAQWSVVGNVGYFGSSYEGSTFIYDWNSGYLDDYYKRRERYYSVGAQLRHYFGSRRPRPLTGWFAAANLQVTQQQSSAEYRQYSQYNYSSDRNSVQLQVMAGRQWALGRRLTLDSYLGISMQRRPWSNQTVGSQSVWIDGGLGLQVGYRFQPLPRR